MKSVHLGRNETPEMEKQFGLCFGKLPAEELYVAKNDPYQLKYVASNPDYPEINQEFSRRLMADLKDARDPRVLG